MCIRDSAGTVNNINGGTSVSIIGREGITFTGDIIGGSFENSGQAQYTIRGCLLYTSSEVVYGDVTKKVIITTAGRVRFNEIWPRELGYINRNVCLLYTSRCV